MSDFDTNILAIMRDVLGPDVQAGVWREQILPADSVYERRIADSSTHTYWSLAHRDDTPYHQRFSGYCPRCQMES